MTSIPSEIAALTSAPLFTANYTGTERASWWTGIPFVSQRATSQRSVAFSNEFDALRTKSGEPFMYYGARNLDDAINAAGEIAWNWSDPAFGGSIGSTVGAAVLQADDGAYYVSLFGGDGNPVTSSGELGYRIDRFDGDIRGATGDADDLRTTSPWSAPVDKYGRPSTALPPSDGEAVAKRRVEGVSLPAITPNTPRLRAVVDARKIYYRSDAG